MEDVLDVYHRPYDAKRPLVCLDEASKQLIGEVIARRSRPRRASPSGSTTSTSATGTANLFMISEPLPGWRAGHGDRAADGAWTSPRCVRWLVEDVHDPEAEKIVLVMDNLNTHKLASLVRGVPAGARPGGSPSRLEIHHTPKHGSWLNMAEIELSVLRRPVPGPADRRPGGRCEREVAAWEDERNERPVDDRLALHHRRRPDQAQASLPRPPTRRIRCARPLEPVADRFSDLPDDTFIRSGDGDRLVRRSTPGCVVARMRHF